MEGEGGGIGGGGIGRAGEWLSLSLVGIAWLLVAGRKLQHGSFSWLPGYGIQINRIKEKRQDTPSCQEPGKTAL